MRIVMILLLLSCMSCVSVSAKSTSTSTVNGDTTVDEEEESHLRFHVLCGGTFSENRDGKIVAVEESLDGKMVNQRDGEEIDITERTCFVVENTQDMSHWRSYF